MNKPAPEQKILVGQELVFSISVKVWSASQCERRKTDVVIGECRAPGAVEKERALVSDRNEFCEVRFCLGKPCRRARIGIEPRTLREYVQTLGWNGGLVAAIQLEAQ